MKNRLLRIAIIAVLSFVFLGVVKNPLAGLIVSGVSSKVVGAPVKIGGFSLGIFRPAVRIKNFRLYNPKGYPREVLIDIPEISVGYDLAALFKKRLHLYFLTVNLQEMVVIKSKDGKLNVDSLQVAQKKKDEKPSEALPMQIDTFTLSIGKVVYKDFSVGEKPSIKVYEVGIKNKTYKNITSAQQLAVLVLTEPMKATAIKGAKIYGAATILGIGLLPVGIVSVFAAKDNAQADFEVGFDRAYSVSLEVLRQMGELVKEEKGQGIITGTVSGCDVNIRIIKKTEKSLQIAVSARKLLMPKPQIAGGVLREIYEKLK